MIWILLLFLHAMALQPPAQCEAPPPPPPPVEVISRGLQVGGAIDRSTASVLNLGTVNATALNFGAPGVTTTIMGDLRVRGRILVEEDGR